MCSACRCATCSGWRSVPAAWMSSSGTGAHRPCASSAQPRCDFSSDCCSAPLSRKTACCVELAFHLLGEWRGTNSRSPFPRRREPTVAKNQVPACGYHRSPPSRGRRYALFARIAASEPALTAGFRINPDVLGLFAVSSVPFACHRNEYAQCSCASSVRVRIDAFFHLR